MKTVKMLLTALGVAVLFTACHTPQSDTEKAVTAYIKAKSNDPASYESVEFSKVDTVYTEFDTSPEGLRIAKELTALNTEAESNNKRYDDIKSENELSGIKYSDWYTGSKFDKAEHKTMDSLQDANKVILAKGDSITKQIDEQRAEFKKGFGGYKVKHSFRAKNAIGALILQKYTFTVDPKFEVTSATPDDADKE